MVDLSKLDELKKMIMIAEDFAEPWDFFLDHFGGNRDFMALGKNVRSPMLTELFKRVAKEFCDGEVQVTRKMFKQLKKQRFVHGAATLGNQMATVMFFQDIDMGMLSFTAGGETMMIRFTSYQVKGDEPLSFPPTVSREPN